MRGTLGCTGQCGSCPAARNAPAGVSGLGAFYESWPAPFNDPYVLIIIAVVAVIYLTRGGRKASGFFGARRDAKRASRLRLARAEAALKEAQIQAA
jgi:hypothetical protein